ncbi:MAG: Zn-ribbon domain-containing OB-fold protein, partial [Spongiibacteraceae bacterium]
MEAIDKQKVDYSWDIPYRAVLGDTYAVFMDGMKDKKLMGNVCTSCKGVHFPPKPFCELCFEECNEWVELDEAATLVTYAVCYV